MPHTTYLYQKILENDRNNCRNRGITYFGKGVDTTEIFRGAGELKKVTAHTRKIASLIYLGACASP